MMQAARSGSVAGLAKAAQALARSRVLERYAFVSAKAFGEHACKFRPVAGDQAFQRGSKCVI